MLRRIKNFTRKFQTEILVKNDIKSMDMMPGPRGFLGLGNVFNYTKPFGKYSWLDLHKSGMDKYRKYGSIVCERMVPGFSIVWLYDPNDIAQIFNDGIGNFPCRRSHLALQKYRQDRPETYRSGGILPTNGQEWWKLRSEFQKGLSSPQNVRNLLPQTDDMVREFISVLPSRFDNDCTIQDFVSELERLSLELTCLIAFDQRMNSFAEEERDPNSRTSRLIIASDNSNDAVLPTDQGLQLWRFFETPTYKKLRKAQEYKEKIVIEFIQKKAYQKDKGNSLLDQYLNNPNINVKDIVGMSADLLLGGIHTTSFSTSFAMYHIARNERIQNLLHQEAMKVLPTFDDKVTTQVMNSEIPYTRAVLKETFRLNPVSIGVGRILNHDTILGGYLVPKDTTVVTQNFVACRLEENFSDPLTFLPERWLKTNHQKSNIHPYLVIPFGHGMRSCIARRLAEQAILTVVLRILRDYKLEWKGCEELDISTRLINRPKSDVTIKFIKRN
ncbi:unnamed protein product [Chironomus riparius]|uniref:Cytochrome P450 302a1, mitochondrial n=1 Tax=Chironomus riparius TaxID=315576 RepID=A0A9N9RKW3_9DIPT|nr:unnamed protein product [Chironomus riparius]